MSHREATLATRRFGLGPRPGDIARIAADPRGYVLAALGSRAAAAIEDAELEPSHLSFQALRAAQRQQREARNQMKQALPPDAPAASGGPTQPRPATGDEPRPGQIRREVFREEARARLERAITTDAPFLERLVLFWSSHFSVSAAKGPMVRVLAGAFEREAIRPHVLGRFSDMLSAVVKHPAMLIYLDNAQSIGPDSRAGKSRGRGLNENLAREILELHTLGVGGGYSQADVTALAKVLTGWTVADPQMAAGLAARPKLMAELAGQTIEPGRFLFTPHRHEPGPRTILGKRYEDRGQETGEAVLADLARHPATARHIAAKLARHFVSDVPPAALVARLTETFKASGGDLARVARTVVTSPEAWEMPPRKIVPPWDFMVSLIRAFGLKPRPPEVVRLSAALGQPLWAPPSPKGWPDEDGAWMGPSAMRERLRIAERTAREIDRGLDPRAAGADLVGEALSDETRQAIERAEAREQGFELLAMSPELMRR
jgi:uncharacterized protein (DUF1800 family)